MPIDHIKRIELEITSHCNAACPGCARTLSPENLKLQSFSLEDLKRLFPNDHSIRDKQFKFCGVLGDPAMNPEFVAMVDYLTLHGGRCEMSTNGGVQSAQWWANLGEIGAKRPGLLSIHFCIDGHSETNHIYRVNTKFPHIERNMTAYRQSYGEQNPHATWIYIIFDHNEHELERAKSHAKELGFNFAVRTGMRNSYNSWMTTIKNKQHAKPNQKISITTTGNKEHSKVQIVKELDQFIKRYQNDDLDEGETQKIVKSIVCKYIHEGEIFIASDLTLWPCCFLWDSAFKNKEQILDKLNEFEPEWNSLKKYSIEQITNHPWFQQMLQASWHPKHSKHLPRCIRTCAHNKAYHNEIKYDAG